MNVTGVTEKFYSEMYSDRKAQKDGGKDLLNSDAPSGTMKELKKMKNNKAERINRMESKDGQTKDLIRVSVIQYLISNLNEVFEELGSLKNATDILVNRKG